MKEANVRLTWEHHPIVNQLREAISLGEFCAASTIDQADNLLMSNDPINQKLGIQMYRLAMPDYPEMVEHWLDQHLERFSPQSDSHPRIIHSALWNDRTAFWHSQRREKVDTMLRQASLGLKHHDFGLNRVSIWVLGDVATLRPDLYDSARLSVVQHAKCTSHASIYLFGLEKFFCPLRHSFGQEASFQNSIYSYAEDSEGFLGLKKRAQGLLRSVNSSTEITITSRDVSSANSRQKVKLANQGLDSVSIDVSTEKLTQLALGFNMKQLWMLRDTALLYPDLAANIFQSLLPIIKSNTDGDYTRTTAVTLTDCVIQQPEELEEQALQLVKGFFEQSDNEGTESVLLHMLYPLTFHWIKSDKKKLESLLDTLYQHTNNNAVEHLISLQKQDITRFT